MRSRDRATLAARWRDAVTAAPDAVFLVWDPDPDPDPGAGGAVWTYAEFDALLRRVAGGLAERGVRPGAPVHVVLPNSPAFVAVWLAAANLGAWVVPVDPESSVRELREQRRRVRPVLGVCATYLAARYAEATGGSAGWEAVEVSDMTLDGLSGVPVDWAGHQPRPQDLAAVMFTSGTTSAPKGVRVTQANYAYCGEVMAAAAGLGPTDRYLVVLPMFHANAQYYAFCAAIHAGASVALAARFSASGYLRQAARTGATHASLFAAPMRMILARGAVPVPDLRLRHVWYAQNVTDGQYTELAALLGCRPRQLYGMTETMAAVITNPALDPRPQAMGTPTTGCVVDLRDEHGNEVPDGTVGEVWVHGEAGLTLFDGYLDDPAATRTAFRDGWLRTGDRARRDDDGVLHFAGRLGEVLKVAGENVSVVEVEAVLAEHPGVLEAAVVGRPDGVRDEVPVAYVVTRPDAPVFTIEELAAHCADRLAPAKRPREYHLVDQLPRTSVGKIRKFLLGTNGA